MYSNTSQTSASTKHTICVPLEKSICVSNYLWGLRRSRCFFLSLPPLSSLEMFVCLSLIFPLYFSLNFDIRTYPQGCLSQTAVQHCDNAFVLPNLFMNFLFSYPFFCSFPQGLAHLMLNRQGMGSIVLLFPPSHLNTQRSFGLLCCTNISSPLFIFYIYLPVHFMLPLMLFSLLTQYLSVKPLSWPLTDLLEHLHLCSFTPR